MPDRTTYSFSVEEIKYFGKVIRLCLAPFFFVAGIAVLVSNESQFRESSEALKEGRQSVVDLHNISEWHNNPRLVHLIGNTSFEVAASDSFFGIAPEGALRLKRKVEEYQWVEHETTDTHQGNRKTTTASYSKETTDTHQGNRKTTTASYSKEWTEKKIDSNHFRERHNHQNPNSDWLFKSETIEANRIAIGNFSLGEDIINEMDWFQPFSEPLSIENITDQYTRNTAKVHKNYFYFGNPEAAQIGDFRVSFQIVPSQTVSIVAKQVRNTLTIYCTKRGTKFLLVEPGAHDAKDMFLHAKRDLNKTVWTIRIVGLIFVLVALLGCLNSLSIFLDAPPDAGSETIHLYLTSTITILVVALLWLSCRSVVAIILSLMIRMTWVIVRKQQTNRAKRMAVPGEEENYEITTVHADPFSDNGHKDGHDDMLKSVV